MNLTSQRIDLLGRRLPWRNKAGPPAPKKLFGPAFVFALLLVFAGISWRAFSSIPKFLAQPAWCQELLVMAGL